MIGLLIGGLVAAALAAYAADRLLKARAQVRRLRRMADRLAAATTRAEKQQEQRQAAARASAALTNVMPAIERPPLTLPGLPPRDPARSTDGCERAGHQEHRAAHPGAPGAAGVPGAPGHRRSRSGPQAHSGPHAAARAGHGEAQRGVPHDG